MPIHIRVADADDEMIRSLSAWLTSDPDVRALGAPRRVGGPDPESMGPVLDVLEFAIPAAISAGNLMLAIAGWRRARRPAPTPPVIVTRGDVVVVVDRDDPDEVAAMVEALDRDTR